MSRTWTGYPRASDEDSLPTYLHTHHFRSEGWLGGDGCLLRVKKSSLFTKTLAPEGDGRWASVGAKGLSDCRPRILTEFIVSVLTLENMLARARAFRMLGYPPSLVGVGALQSRGKAAGVTARSLKQAIDYKKRALNSITSPNIGT
jgi:hypothetical protein